MITDLSDFFELDIGFNIFDLFGKHRMQEALDQYDTLRFVKNQKIAELDKTIRRQGQMLRDAYAKIEELKQENKNKDALIDEFSKTLEEERHKNLFAESSKATSMKAAEKLSMQNTELRVALNKSRLDYEDLAETHERLLDVIKRERPDILLDDVEKDRKAS